MQIVLWWKSTGFYTSLLIIIGIAISGFSPDEAKGVISAVLAAISAVWAFYGKIKDMKPLPWRDWLTKPNTIAAIGASLAFIWPSIPGGLFQAISDVLTALLNKQWNLAIGGFIVLVNIVINWSRSKPPAAAKV